MPFSEPLSYTSPYRGPAEVRGRTHGALHVFIQEPVIEAREEGGREAVSGEQTVRRRFLCGQVLGVFGGGGCGGGRGHALLRSIRTSVSLPYARRRMASLSMSALDRPGCLLMALRSCARGELAEPPFRMRRADNVPCS